MGLSASQARYISLVARMSDIEYQGQQINQERTTLSNQVNDLYNSLLDLSVPTPPSTSEYTEVRYETSIGATRYTIDSVLPDGDNYRITFSYTDVGHYLNQVGGIRIERDGDEYTYTTEDGQHIPLMYLSDPDALGQIGPDNINKYLTAIQNYFPEYANDDPATIEGDFMVYFTTENGTPTPHFLRADQVLNINDHDYEYIARYDYMSNGTFPAHREFTDCTLTFDAQGLISIVGVPTAYDPQGHAIERTNYRLTATTVTNQEAYDNAFREYEAAKYLYDRKQTEINAKTSIIQREDKNLELKLTRLDNERSAVKTEIDAVKKVIDDAIEKGFKTFSG